MSSWTKPEEELLKKLREANTFAQIVRTFSTENATGSRGFETPRSADAISRKLRRMRYANQPPVNQQLPLVEKLSATPAVDTEHETYKKQLAAMHAIADAHKPKTVTREAGVNLQVTTKILSLSDIHFPCADIDMLMQAINDHDDADIVVLNGDIMDGYSFSSFEKTKRVAALDEYRLAFKLIKLLSEHFPTVVLVDGNHDVRVSRALREAGLTKEATDILRPNLMARLANGEELDANGQLIKKHNFDNVVYDPVESWYVMIGKTIFVHPHGKGSRKPGFTVDKASGYFAQRYDPDEYDSVVSGHTHKMYKGIVNGKLLIEQGTLASLQVYSHSPKLEFTDPAINGYAVVYQDADGNTDFNLSGPIYKGMVMPPKKRLL